MGSRGCTTCSKRVNGRCNAIQGINDLTSAWALCQGALWKHPEDGLPFLIAYQGCDEEESMAEYLLDIGMTESDYVGFDVGDQ